LGVKERLKKLNVFSHYKMEPLSITRMGGGYSCYYKDHYWASAELRPLPQGYGIRYTTNDSNSGVPPIKDWKGDVVTGIEGLYSKFEDLGEITHEEAMQRALTFLEMQIIKLLGFYPEFVER